MAPRFKGKGTVWAVGWTPLRVANDGSAHFHAVNGHLLKDTGKIDGVYPLFRKETFTLPRLTKKLW